MEYGEIIHKHAKTNVKIQHASEMRDGLESQDIVAPTRTLSIRKRRERLKAFDIMAAGIRTIKSLLGPPKLERNLYTWRLIEVSILWMTSCSY